jgi:hypothetical protein
MVRPFTVLLDTVGDGVKLTAAGYLPPAVVQTIFDELDMGDEWIGHRMVTALAAVACEAAPASTPAPSTVGISRCPDQRSAVASVQQRLGGSDERARPGDRGTRPA